MNHPIRHLRESARNLVQGALIEAENGLTKKFSRDPFGSAPVAGREEYEALHETARGLEFPDVDRYEEETGHAIDRDWFEALALITQVPVKPNQPQYPHGRVLYSALRHRLDALDPGRVPTILETGTARGFSALCLAKALRDADRPGGTILTIDLLPHDVPIFWNSILDCDGRKRTRAELLADYAEMVEDHLLFLAGDSQLILSRLQCPRIHFASLDGGHNYGNVAFEGAFLARFQQSGDVIYFDDYNPGEFDGLARAVDEFFEAHPYEREVVTYGENRMGILATRVEKATGGEA